MVWVSGQLETAATFTKSACADSFLVDEGRLCSGSHGFQPPQRLMPLQLLKTVKEPNGKPSFFGEGVTSEGRSSRPIQARQRVLGASPSPKTADLAVFGEGAGG